MTLDPVPAQPGKKAHWHIQNATQKWVTFREAMRVVSQEIVNERRGKH